jgi:RNA polymerase subunit RPABC4/transcription elongation factor Spt4
MDSTTYSILKRCNNCGELNKKGVDLCRNCGFFMVLERAEKGG